MENKNLNYNAADLEADLQCLNTVLESRLKSFVEKKATRPVLKFPRVASGSPVSIYRKFVDEFHLNNEERLILLLSLLPFISPYLIENALIKFGIDNKQIPEIGGIRGATHGGIIPTGETALFLLAGNDIEKRLKGQLLFSPRHKFYTKNILRLEETNSYEPETSGAISISKDVLHMLTNATAYQPIFNTNFPAKKITTKYKYDEMVLQSETEHQLDEIRTWLKHRKILMKEWGFEHKMCNGYKSLFYGPPGTGKSMAAALIGKQNDMPVYRIDLSMVISKYIGETEKNISKIFDAAGNNDWILFFDEADALFGKRSNIQNANDRYANQEVSYLLMRMEEYEGLAILATNLKNNIDKAFLRRFQSVVHFPAPGKEERFRLWNQSFSDKTAFADDVDIKGLAANFSLTGASIMNVTRYASTMALQKGNNIITKENILTGVRMEIAKDSSISGESGNHS